MNEGKKTKKGDFIELEYKGFANGEMFDSNIPEELKKLNPEAKAEKLVVVIGEGMVVPGLDKGLEGRKVGEEFTINVPCKEGFGDRKRELMRTIPLSAFKEQKVNPQPGMLFTLDNALVKIVAVSGARVIADFNNPLAGKDLKYEAKVVKIVEDVKEKCEAFFKFYMRFLPEFDVKEKEIVAKGPKGFDVFLNTYEKKFKDLIGLDLKFEETKKEEGLEEKVKEEEKKDSKDS